MAAPAHLVCAAQRKNPAHGGVFCFLSQRHGAS
ncbi:protein of unknown function [Cupriavidus taiwanensis]|nr:protein of unknown function [Cupriavidus taiwanensis]